MEAAHESPMEQTQSGKMATGEGWFVLNAREAPWASHPKFGHAARFEGKQRFGEIGVNLRMLQPGQPNCYYHRESTQEDFLVLSGECIAILEGQERRLRAWDYVHCAPGTAHVFVGAGDGPCLILMLGARNSDAKIVYPVEPVALKHNAGVQQETPDPQVAYAGLGTRQPVPLPQAAAALLQDRPGAPQG